MKTETLRLYGPVGAGMFGDDGESITAAGVAKALDAAKAKGASSLDVYLSSDGGMVGEGLAVYAQIQRFKGDVTITVDGRAVSIASVIALAGNRLVMPKSALMMIHAPWNIAVGNAEKLRKAADDLEVMATTMRGIYAAASGLSEDKVRTIMDEETWLTADEALALGFADEVLEDQKPAASRPAARASLLDLYRKTPGSLRAASATAALARLESTLMRQRIEEQTRGARAASPGQPGSSKTHHQK